MKFFVSLFVIMTTLSTAASSGETVEKCLPDQTYQGYVIFSEEAMPPVLREVLLESNRDFFVLMIAGHGSFKLAKSKAKIGRTDYIDATNFATDGATIKLQSVSWKNLPAPLKQINLKIKDSELMGREEKGYLSGEAPPAHKIIIESVGPGGIHVLQGGLYSESQIGEGSHLKAVEFVQMTGATYVPIPLAKKCSGDISRL